MAARVLWKGAISFGLVHIPIRLHTATRDTAIHFHLLTEDGTCRLRRKLVCPDTGEEIDFARTARGLEVAPGQYVLVSDEEIASLRPDQGRSIEIQDFVDLAEIDPVYFDRPYWVSPGEGGSRPYRLLVETLQDSGKVGIARFVMREKEYLAAVRVIGAVLAISTMHWHDEVVPRGDAVETVKARVDERQKELALQLVEQLTRPFEPARYRNTFQEKLKELVERKAVGEAIEVRETPIEPTTEVIDLQAALEASLRGETVSPKAVRAGGSHGAAKATAKGEKGAARSRAKAPAKAAPAKPAAKAKKKSTGGS